MKINKTIEYDLESMSIWELRDFLAKYYDVKTEFLINKYLNIGFIYNHNDILRKVTFLRVEDEIYRELERWYIKRIKQLEKVKNNE